MRRTREVLTTFGITALTLLFSPTAKSATCSAKAVTCGSTVTDSLDPNSSCIIDTFPTANYAFSGTAGQILSLVASNQAGLDMFMTLTNSSGQTIATSFLDEPATITKTLPATDQYLIAINYGNPHSSGSFTLSVSCETCEAS